MFPTTRQHFPWPQHLIPKTHGTHNLPSRPEWIVPPHHSNLNNENRVNTTYYARPSSPLPTRIPNRVGNGTHFANRVRNGVFGPFAEWRDHELRQSEVEVHDIERLENDLIENDIKVARRSLRPDNAKDGENGRWRMVNGLPVPVVDVDVGQDDYWDKDLKRVVLVGPILADRVRENGGLGTIPAAVAAAPDRNAENDVRDNGEARDSDDALMPENSVSAPSQPAILLLL